MRNTITALFCIVILFVSGQEEKLPESLLCSSVLLETDVSQGSGIFLRDSKLVYFITARHNLFSMELKNNKIDTLYLLKSKKGKFIFYPHNIVTDDQAIINIDLLGSYDDGLIKFDKNQDIAIIFIGSITSNDTITNVTYTKHIAKNKSTWLHLWSTNATREYAITNIGAETYLFGYPGSIGLKKSPQFDYERPLLRKGIIAGKYEKRKTIILDSPVYFGNSGGPVFELYKIKFTTYISLIGITTQYIPYIEEWKNNNNGAVNTQTMNSGYSIVTSIEYALELMKEFK